MGRIYRHHVIGNNILFCDYENEEAHTRPGRGVRHASGLAPISGRLAAGDLKILQT
jgi:hypothetical protein